MAKTANSLRGGGVVIKQTFTMLKPSVFMDTYSVTHGCITNFIELPKTWFRTVNGIGAVTDGVLTVDDLIEMFLEEEE